MLNAVSLLKNCYLFRIFKKEVLDFSLLYMITWMYHQYYVAVWKHQGKDNAFVENHKKNDKETEKSRKQKLIEGEATELKRKKSLLGNIISELHEEADKYAYQK